MQCPNCGKQTPFAGNVCHHCGHEKHAAKIGQVVSFIGVIIGMGVGIAYFGTFWWTIGCMLIGAVPGVLIRDQFS